MYRSATHILHQQRKKLYARARADLCFKNYSLGGFKASSLTRFRSLHVNQRREVQVHVASCIAALCGFNEYIERRVNIFRS